MDRGAWQAAVHRVAQSQTGLKRLSMHALSKQLQSLIFLIYIFILGFCLILSGLYLGNIYNVYTFLHRRTCKLYFHIILFFFFFLLCCLANFSTQSFRLLLKFWCQYFQFTLFYLLTVIFNLNIFTLPLFLLFFLSMISSYNCFILFYPQSLLILL